MSKVFARRGKEPCSLLEGPIWKGLLTYALPLLMGNLFQQLYSAVDTLIVGNFLGKQALAAVSSSGNLIFMLVGFLAGVAMGAGVLISKCYGARDYGRMSAAIHTIIAFGFVTGLAMTVIGTLLTPYILRWMGTPENVLPESIAYFRTYFYGCTAIFIYNNATGILQAVGDSKRPLYYLIVSSALNVALDLLFVGVFQWGVASAAAATAISQGVSAILCMKRLVRTTECYRVELKRIRIEFPILKQIISFGLPAGIQNSVIGFANVVVQANINAFGDSAMAGCGSYSKVEGFSTMPLTCFSMVLATFVGQNLGAKKYDRVKKGAFYSIIFSMIMAECIGLVIYTFAPDLVGLFNDSADVVAFGVKQARTLALFYSLAALTHSIAGILRGAGKATIPMLTILSCWCIFRVVYVTAITQVWNDIRAVFTAYPLTWLLSSIVLIIYYRKADWIHTFDRLDAAVEGQ